MLCKLHVYKILENKTLVTVLVCLLKAISDSSLQNQRNVL